MVFYIDLECGYNPGLCSLECEGKIPRALKRPDVYILHYHSDPKTFYRETEDICRGVNNYVAFLSMGALRHYVNTKLSELERELAGMGVALRKTVYRATDPAVSIIFEKMGTDEKVDIEELKRRDREELEELAKSQREELRRRLLEEANAKKRLIVLVDGSRESSQAWDEAWLYVSKLSNASITVKSIDVWMFKEPSTLTPEEEKGVIYRNKYAAIIDLKKIKRSLDVIPSKWESGVAFEGRSPLLEALKMSIMIARKKYPEDPIEIVVVSINRDNFYAADDKYAERNDEDIVIEAKEKAGVKLSLLPLKGYQDLYLDKYDEVKEGLARAMILLNLI